MKKENWIQQRAEHWFLLLVITFGVALVLSAQLARFAEYQAFLSGTGGGIAGAALGAWFGVFASDRTARRVDSIVEKHELLIADRLRAEILAPDTDLTRYCGQLHVYWRTRDRQSEFWIHRTLDLAASSGQWKLIATDSLVKGGRHHDYAVEGTLFGRRLLLVGRNPEEDPYILLVPRFGLDPGSGWWAIQYHNDWNHEDGIDAALVSWEAIDGVEAEHPTEAQSQLLERRWREWAPRTWTANRLHVDGSAGTTAR